jgi:tol-pal system protein YbgF
MKTSQFLASLAFISFASLAIPAEAVDNDQLMQRLDHLEHDIQLLQQQVATTPSAPGGGGSGAPITDAASLEVRLSNLDDQMRSLRGQLEENQYQMRKVTDTLDKLQKDTEFRFSELSKNPGSAPQAPSNLAPTMGGNNITETNPSGLTSAGDGVLRLPQGDGNNASPSLSTPREHYNYAFKLLNQAQYPEAAAAFDTFIKRYPKDPLIGNAYYWEGETYYIRRDYVSAADNFRQGFESLPEGPKAPDNLFKLALSLDAMNRDKEACVVLQQVTTKFKKASSNISQRADQEQKRIGCS